MLEFLRPGFLLAGSLAALVPLLLHLIVRRPPERAPLPTLRFLRPDPRTAIRLRRRPADLWLLLPRMLLLLLLGAAFAGPHWRPLREGTAEVVLLDRSAAMRGAWEPAVAEAARLLLAPEGEARGTLVLFDSVATLLPRGRLSVAVFDSLAAEGHGSGAPDYGTALRAIRAAVAELGEVDSIRVHLLSSPRWEGWRPGLAQLRLAAWPGALHLTELRSAADGEPTIPLAAPRGRASVIAPPGEGRFVEAALGAMGWSVARVAPGSAPAEQVEAFLVLGPAGAELAQTLAERAAAGATVVYAGELPPAPRPDFPWEPERAEAAGAANAGGGALYFGSGLVLAGAEGHFAGAPAPGALLLAAREDGRPAAAAQRRGTGCVVFLAVPLEAGTLPLSAGYPTAVDQLARGCEGLRPDRRPAAHAGGGLPLDAGALAILRGEGRPPVIEARAVGGPVAAVPLGRWLLLAALGLALLETLLVYARRSGT